MQSAINTTSEKNTAEKQTMVKESFWQTLQEDALHIVTSEPLLASYAHACILNHRNFESALSFILANKLSDKVMPALAIREVFMDAYHSDPSIIGAGISDVKATFDRDPAVHSHLMVLIHFKGYQSVQVHRLAHYLWNENRKDLALFIQSRNSEVFGVDIHPAARIGKGVMFDHATGIVIGETTIVEDNVSILQSVTLGGTGKVAGDRHPKVREGVMIGAGAKILGNIEIGRGSKVGAGSVVLNAVPPHVTVVGAPAKIVGRPCCSSPCETMDQNVLQD